MKCRHCNSDIELDIPVDEMRNILEQMREQKVVAVCQRCWRSIGWQLSSWEDEDEQETEQEGNQQPCR